MSFKVLIVSSMVGMLLPLLKFKISSSRKWAKYSVRSGFGYKIVTDKYNFDFCFESRNFTSQAEGAACENVSKKRMRPPCAIVCFLVVASDTIIIRQDMAF